MPFLVPDRQFSPDQPEMMDMPGIDEGLLRQDLRNLRVINRFFGGLAAVRKHIRPLFDRIPNNREISILDLASGSGDQAASILRFAHSLGRRVRITGVDTNPVMLNVARAYCRGLSEIDFREANILELREGEWNADITICSLVLHHFSAGDAVRVMALMDRISNVGFIVNDLNRHRWAAVCAWTYAHLTSLNPLTLNDTPVSILRAFTPDELRSMAGQAGIRQFRLFREPMFRLILVGEH